MLIGGGVVWVDKSDGLSSHLSLQHRRRRRLRKNPSRTRKKPSLVQRLPRFLLPRRRIIRRAISTGSSRARKPTPLRSARIIRQGLVPMAGTESPARSATAARPCTQPRSPHHQHTSSSVTKAPAWSTAAVGPAAQPLALPREAAPPTPLHSTTSASC